FSVLLASGIFALELAFSIGWTEFIRILTWMALVHAGIGMGEALITGLVLRFILLTRPDLVYQPESEAVADGRLRGWGQVLVAGLAISVAVGVFLAPFASEHPDGLEFVGEKLGFLKGEAPAILPVPIPDYQVEKLFDSGHVKLATAVAGLVGTL